MIATVRRPATPFPSRGQEVPTGDSFSFGWPSLFTDPIDMSPGFGDSLTVLLPVVAVTAAALLTIVVDWFTPEDDMRSPATVSLIGVVVAGVLLAALRSGASQYAFVRGAVQPAGGGPSSALVVMDGLGMFVQATLLMVCALTILISVRYLPKRGIAKAEYFVLLLFATAGMMLVSIALDLMIFFLALETFSIALYVLAGFARHERLSQEAGLKYFLLGAFASGFLLYGISLIYAATGSTNLEVIGATLAAPAPGPVFDSVGGARSISLTLWVGFGLALAGMCFKVALVPFHQWTPDVYEGAPVTVTGFMAAGTKVAAFAALIRFLWTGFAELAHVWVPMLAVLALLTMFVGNLTALFQSDLKRMLGYSAIAHGGYVLVAVIAGPPSGIGAALYYLLIYAFMNLGAFAVLAAAGPIPVTTSEAPGTHEGAGPSAGPEVRDASRLSDLSGLASRHLPLAAALSIFLVSLTGLPPLAGFLGKWYIISAAVDSWLLLLAAAIVVNSVLSALYYLRPILVMFTQKVASDRPIDVPVSLAVAILVCAAVTVLAIVVSGPIVEAAATAEGVAQSNLVPPGH